MTFILFSNTATPPKEDFQLQIARKTNPFRGNTFTLQHLINIDYKRIKKYLLTNN